MDFFDIFQLSVLILFLVVLLGDSFRLSSKGIRVFVSEKGKCPLRVAVDILFLTVLMLWIYEIINNAINISFSPLPVVLSEIFYDSLFLKYMGAVLIGIGFLFFILALIALGPSWRIGIDTDHPGKLVTTGIFSITRNPVFIFIMLYFTGTAMVYTSWFFSGLAVMAFFGIHWHILKEEKIMTKIYGEAYNAYRKKTKRYF